MIELSFASNESRRCVLNRLKWTKMGFSDTDRQKDDSTMMQIADHTAYSSKIG